ncbi:serine/threonine-protein kinase [Streptomyces durocortorensis]|uniref:serine/threonine-protein kinase n=1 Tax=Streptomyces durocortorensis TaxID=2811104 RepID=UPI0027DADE53|nr:serine/threonine-protein kinase [Streptomyces durocortorensis]
MEGLDLSRHVARHGPLPSLLTASLGATLAEALATVHKQGMLHRDLKPANVLLGPNGPKVIDFGLAVFAESSVSLTAPNTVVGTPSCMPPEQARGDRPLTPAVDVYALGAVMLFAASGRLPYQAANIHVLFHQVTDPETAPDLSGAPNELVPLLTAMLAHQAEDRPALSDVVQQCRGVIEAQGFNDQAGGGLVVVAESLRDDGGRGLEDELADRGGPAALRWDADLPQVDLEADRVHRLSGLAAGEEPL